MIRYELDVPLRPPGRDADPARPALVGEALRAAGVSSWTEVHTRGQWRGQDDGPGVRFVIDLAADLVAEYPGPAPLARLIAEAARAVLVADAVVRVTWHEVAEVLA